MSLRRAFLSLIALALCPACGGGGGGDPPTKPLANEYGGGQRISEVVGPATAWENINNASSVDCAYPLDVSVNITGSTLIAVDTFDETGAGAVGNYYIEDTVADPQPYSGVTVFGAAFTPPDLRLFESDVVDTFGSKDEFPGPAPPSQFSYCRTLPELSGTMSFRFDGTAAFPAKTVPLSDMVTCTNRSYDNTRQWMSMLVTLKDVTVFPGSSSDGRYTALIDVSTLNGQCKADLTCSLGGAPCLPVGSNPPKEGDACSAQCGSAISVGEQPSLSNELFDLEKDGPDLSVARKFSSVTGIVTFFYEFHIAPRSAADFVP